MVKNIIFSTTRQWNPGDEIILKGIINLLKSFGIEFNPLIYNRNPDIRGFFGVSQYRKKADIENEWWYYIKSGMMDNSVKPWMEYDNIDAIIFAGTPEWQGQRSRELYINAIKYRIPVYLIGIDSIYDGEDPVISSVLEKAKFISIRNKKVKNSFIEKKIIPIYLPCPSIFACNVEKTIDKVKCIGLIYRGKEENVTYGNGWNEELYQLQIEFYYEIIKLFKKQCRIIIICHYVDEVYWAQRDFASEEVRYSYDSEDYIDIYKNCDIVIGSRIHGIGLASSLCIPSISMRYDKREGTIDGFYPDNLLFDGLNGLDGVKKCILNIKEMNQELVKYKRRVLLKYQELFKSKIEFKKVYYNYNLIQLKSDSFRQLSQKLCESDLDLHNQLMEYFVKVVLDYINNMIRGKKIIIKGGGFHTKKLLKYLTNEIDIVGIADNKIDIFEKFCVMRNNEIIKFEYDYIIISSYRFEKEMLREMDELGVSDKVLSLYRIMEDNFTQVNQAFFVYLKDIDLP